MSNHMEAIGFHVKTEEDFQKLAIQAVVEGDPLPSPHGAYVRWAPGSGIQLWAQLNKEDEIVGCNPHFDGGAHTKADIVEIIRDSDYPVDGRLIGWNRHRLGGIEEFPFVVDVPDFDLTPGALLLPATATVQIAAFAHEMTCYATEKDLEATQSPLATEAFLPVGMFEVDGKPIKPPSAEAILSGRVLKARRLENPATHGVFHHATIATLGMVLDIVVGDHPARGVPTVQGVIQGRFWLSGRIIRLD